MHSMLRMIVLSATALTLATPLFAQGSLRRLPEGGSELAYLSLTGISCLGVIWYRIRRK